MAQSLVSLIIDQFKSNVARNTAWLFGENVLRMVLGLFVGVFVARYLGPEKFGLLSYAFAFVTLFSAFTNLGLDSFVIRDLVSHPEQKDELLGTTFTLKLFGAGATFLLSVLTVLIMRPDERFMLVMVSIIATGSFFQAFDTIDYWFQSEVRSKFTVFARSSAFFLTSLVKVLLVLTGAPLVAFALAILAEGILVSLCLLWAYLHTHGHLRAWSFQWGRAKRLLAESWPLFLSVFFVTLYLKIDQVMIGQMLGDDDVGMYSASVRLTEVWYFIPIVITSSVFPAIVQAKKQGQEAYNNIFKKLFLLLLWLSLTVACLVTVFAQPFVELFFGQEFIGAAGPLAIQCWAGIFIFAGMVSNQWYLLENLSRYTFYRNVFGAGINVVLNLFFIPRFGINGAAFATLITQLGTSYLFDGFNKKTRPVFIMKSRCFFFFLPMTFKAIFK